MERRGVDMKHTSKDKSVDVVICYVSRVEEWKWGWISQMLRVWLDGGGNPGQWFYVPEKASGNLLENDLA